MDAMAPSPQLGLSSPRSASQTPKFCGSHPATQCLLRTHTTLNRHHLMSDSLPELLERIESFRFDPPGCSLTFADRLARENGWSSGHADRVIREYLRFCVLAVHCDHPVTPSVDVDQAWHLHLTYTRSYWDHFCKTVLQQPLHHDPTTGGSS